MISNFSAIQCKCGASYVVDLAEAVRRNNQIECSECQRHVLTNLEQMHKEFRELRSFRSSAPQHE